jgi:uncharacterized protein
MVNAEHQLPRRHTDLVVERLQHLRIVAVLGARQVGKSTLISQVLRRVGGMNIANLDDQGVLRAAKSDPTGFLAARGRPLVIDEIQRAPDLLLAMKVVVDQDRSPGQYLVTGSANLRLLRTLPDSLPGRISYLTLQPFSQGELGGVRETFVDRAFENVAAPIFAQPIGRAPYVERISAGGYPEAHRLPEFLRESFFRDYLEALLDQDLSTISQVTRSDDVLRVFSLALARTASLLNSASMGRELKLDHKTVAHYLLIAERLHLLTRLPAWSGNLGKRVIRAPKIHAVDSGLVCSILGASPQRLVEDLDGSLAGPIFETFVVGELLKQSGWSLSPTRVFHYRDTNGHEIDAVLERPSGEIIACDAKAAATVQGRDFLSLISLRDAIGPRFKFGAILYTGQDSLPFGDRLWAIPISALWQ